MREYICNLCHKRIKPADIRRSFDVPVDDELKEKVDMHSVCYFKFMAYAKVELIDNFYTVEMKNLE